MRSFTERVKREQENQGLQVFRIYSAGDYKVRPPIDLICMKNGNITLVRARGNGHGNLNAMTVMVLKQLGKKCGAKVLLAKENGATEIVFFRIYNK